MNNVIAYLRVSTEEQATEGISLAAQERAIRAYCDLRNLNLLSVVVDAGISAGKPLSTRPAGNQVMDAVRRKQVNGVVAFKLDRLFRNAQDCLGVTAAWDKQGVALHLLDLGGQSVDTSSAMGRFFLTIMAGAAEMERSLIRERTKLAMGHKSSQGQCVGTAPFGKGLALDSVHLVAEPEEQLVIARILALRQNDGLSLRAIAERLNQEGVRSRGSKWHKTTVQRILKRAA